MHTITLDALATAVLVLDADNRVQVINPAAENLLGISARQARARQLAQLLGDCATLPSLLKQAHARGISITEHNLVLNLSAQRIEASVTITTLEEGSLLEFHPLGGRFRIAQEEHALAQAQASQTLLRQLAHEIRNPLGGIRGAAQLLEAEINESPDLTEYTRVIIAESSRLQALLDRMLAPAKRPSIAPLNVHAVLERVRSLLLAEFPQLTVKRDYDTSLPEIEGDTEQLIQAVLNIARNAAQAIGGEGRIRLASRIARQITLAMKRWPLAIRIDVCDNGPGIPESMRDTLFFPLVSGRDGGTGLGLTLAQTFVQRHGGAIHVESTPGNTCFSIYLPIQEPRP